MASCEWAELLPNRQPFLLVNNIIFILTNITNSCKYPKSDVAHCAVLRVFFETKKTSTFVKKIDGR